MESLGDIWLRFRTRPSAVCGLALLSAIILVAAIGPFIVRGSPWDTVGTPFTWPGHTAASPLGTDILGRDILRGILNGARISLLIGVAAAIVSLFVGVLVGALAGYCRGWVDDLLMRITEVFQTIPNFLFAVVLVSVFGASLGDIVVAIGLVAWTPIARLVRAEFLSLREREFVQSCVVVGMSETNIIFRQILPNALPPVVVMSSILVAGAILTEAGLSFLGLGDPNLMTWGTMIGIGRQALRTGWYIAAIPGVLILLTVLSLNLVGEGLNDALNPRLSNR